ncbi:MAG: hypothetical protein JSV78_02870 [Phycisphaerales bacterium]|nr:MAG: hypothetical protein JSV78_02870 [Phycisphaerales bacterium]
MIAAIFISLLCVSLLWSMHPGAGKTGVGRASGCEAADARASFRYWDRWAYGILCAGFCVAAVTGFTGWLRTGKLDGWWLFIHVVGGGLFAAGLLFSSVRLAERCRLLVPERLAFGDAAAGEHEGTPAGATFSSGQRLVFWTTVVLGFVGVGSIFAGMSSVVGYAVQERLCDLHRYCGVGLLLAACVHMLLLIMNVKKG